MDASEIPDALPEDFPDRPGDGPGERPSPYRNLLVPLVVVPAMIVMILVLVWVFFGAMVGSEKSPTENVQRMIHGSSNERDQAAQLLVAQIFNALDALHAGREPDWELAHTLLPAVQSAYADTAPDEAEHRYVLASVQLLLGDQQGAERLIELLGMGEDTDPGANVRFMAIEVLGVLGPALDPAHRRAATQAVLPFLKGEDAGLRNVAAAALQGLPGEETLAALRGALLDGRLDVRGSAAITLSHLGDSSGSGVLREAIDPAAYAAERAQSPRRWRDAAEVSRSRIRAVQALGRLGRPEDVAVLEAVAREEEDLDVLAEVRRVLADAREAQRVPAGAGG